MEALQQALQQRMARIAQLEIEEQESDREFERYLRTTFQLQESTRQERDRKRRRVYRWTGGLVAMSAMWYALARLAMWAEHWR